MDQKKHCSVFKIDWVLILNFYDSREKYYNYRWDKKKVTHIQAKVFISDSLIF